MQRLSYANVMATIAVVLAVGGGSFAIAQSGSQGTIKGCSHKKSGVLRVLKKGKKCRRSERAIAWNIEGRAGDDGAPGAPGRSGPTGPEGVGGTNGGDGPTGPKGADGGAGPTGVQGPTGAGGATGPAGPTGVQGSPDTAGQILQKLVTVDGPSSGLNADMLDGFNGADFPRKVGSAFVSIGYGAESYDDPGECVEQVFTTSGLANVAIGDQVLVDATRNLDERAPALGLVVTGFVADRLESTTDVPRVHVRACNVTGAVIESAQLNFRVLVLR
jgi:hypothetical protein